jgi:hypothetical protein
MLSKSTDVFFWYRRGPLHTRGDADLDSINVDDSTRSPSLNKWEQYSALRLETPSPECCQYCLATLKCSAGYRIADILGEMISSSSERSFSAAGTKSMMRTSIPGAFRSMKSRPLDAVALVGKSIAASPSLPCFSAIAAENAWICLCMKNLFAH